MSLVYFSVTENCILLSPLFFLCHVLQCPLCFSLAWWPTSSNPHHLRPSVAHFSSILEPSGTLGSRQKNCGHPLILLLSPCLIIVSIIALTSKKIFFPFSKTHSSLYWSVCETFTHISVNKLIIPKACVSTKMTYFTLTSIVRNCVCMCV